MRWASIAVSPGSVLYWGAPGFYVCECEAIWWVLALGFSIPRICPLICILSHVNLTFSCLETPFHESNRHTKFLFSLNEISYIACTHIFAWVMHIRYVCAVCIMVLGLEWWRDGRKPLQQVGTSQPGGSHSWNTPQTTESLRRARTPRKNNQGIFEVTLRLQLRGNGLVDPLGEWCGAKIYRHLQGRRLLKDVSKRRPARTTQGWAHKDGWESVSGSCTRVVCSIFWTKPTQTLKREFRKLDRF